MSENGESKTVKAKDFLNIPAKSLNKKVNISAVEAGANYLAGKIEIDPAYTIDEDTDTMCARFCYKKKDDDIFNPGEYAFFIAGKAYVIQNYNLDADSTYDYYIEILDLLDGENAITKTLWSSATAQIKTGEDKDYSMRQTEP